MHSAGLSPAMSAAMSRFFSEGDFGETHMNTIRALEKRGFVVRTDDGGYRLPTSVRESAAVPRLVARYLGREFSWTPTFDYGTADYAFWDRARKGRAKGLEIAGLFLKPLESKIAAWTLGLLPKFKLEDEALQERIARWFTNNHADVIRTYKEAVGLGDCFIIVNSNLTLTVVPAANVSPLVLQNDFSRVVGWRVTEVYEHPTEPGQRQTIEDDYTRDGRVRRIYLNGALQRTERYRNLIGVVPVVKVSNDAGADEEFGHPQGEAMLALLHAYGAVLQQALNNHHKQGTPTPVLEEMGDMEDINEWWERFGRKEKYTDDEGNTAYEYVVDFDSSKLITLPNGSKFAWKSPGPIAGEAQILLGLLFYLILQHTEIPEFIWGNAIASSKASAESQMPPFEKFIQMKQGECQKWLRRLVLIIAAYYAVIEPGAVREMPAEEDDIHIGWQPLTTADGRLTLDAVKLGMEHQLISDETALSLLPLDIENPAEEVEKARAEAEAKREAEKDAFERDWLAAQVAAQVAAGDDEDEDEEDSPADEDEGEEMESASPRQARPAAYLNGHSANGHGAYLRVLEQEHSGVMVAFFLPKSAANALYRAAQRAGVENITEPEDMHITLAYLGQSDEMSVTPEQVERALASFAQGAPPVVGRINGLGRFSTVEDGDVSAIYASFDSVTLGGWRQDLVEHLAAEGINIQMKHGFIPHITLAYIDVDADTPNVRVPDMEIAFYDVVLAWANDRTEYELEGEWAAPQDQPEETPDEETVPV